MAGYGGYSHIKLTLTDVLEEIDEVLESEKSKVLLASGDEGEDKLSYTIGRIQGIHRTLKKLETKFGVIE